ncbi:unnamed protein product [Symbiodinium natans]|uniref:Uncharacterized protein n=1 Tax=Symbiodinium natans TaxID=878477 RepID=A0A812PKJ5_9DINO|nr:unnamed protein product [Symbiodinium natans]
MRRICEAGVQGMRHPNVPGLRARATANSRTPGALDKLDLVARLNEDGPGSTRSTASTASFGSLSPSSAPSDDEATEKYASNHEIEWFLEAAQRHGLDSSGRASWLQRAMRTLDLEPCTAASTEDEEEDELRHKLVTAIINAERHAKVSEALHEVLGDAATFGEKDLDDIVRPRQRSINFKDSDIRFFIIDPEDEAMREEYCRPLRTKAFDGPSGHKARKASCFEEGLDSSDDESDEEDDDWKDQCDEVADLMGQQRQMVLWSGSW